MTTAIQRLDDLNDRFPNWAPFKDESTYTSSNEFMLLTQHGSNRLLFLVSPQGFNSQEYFSVGSRLLQEHEVEVIQAESSILRLLSSERIEQKKEEITQADQQLFYQLITDAVKVRASDMMINAKRKGLYEVLFDIDTIPEYVRDLTESEVHGMMRYFYQKVAKDSVEESLFSTESAQFAAGTVFINDDMVRLRYQSKEVYPNGMDFVIRLLVQSNREGQGFSEVSDLQLTQDQEAALERVQNREVGAVAVAGETNSGKSTSVKVQLESIKRKRPHVVIRTLESPVEYIFKDIRQHEVRESKSINGDRAMDQAAKELMRMNFKLAYVAEVRGRETARLFVNILESGHGIYITLHTAGTFTVYDRLERQGIDKHITTQAGNINALIYQKRLPQLCNHCKTPLIDVADQNAELIQRLEIIGHPLSTIFLQSESGCSKCHHRGISGSRIAMEIVMPNTAMSQAVLSNDRKLFYKEWVKRCDESGWGDVAETHCYHAIRLMLTGAVSPTALEQAYGAIDKTLLREECNTWSDGGGFSVWK